MKRIGGEDAMKVKKIRIQSLKEGLKEFSGAYHTLSKGGKIKKTEGTFFTSIEAVRRVLTQSRMNLLKAIKKNKPSSIYELAKMAHRDFKNVSQDVNFLADLGLIELGPPRGARHQRRPVLVSDRFSVEFAI